MCCSEVHDMLGGHGITIDDGVDELHDDITAPGGVGQPAAARVEVGETPRVCSRVVAVAAASG